MAAPTTPAEIHEVNTRYHDVAAAGYDAKWAIAFDAGARRQVLGKMAKALGRPPGRWERGLEIGAGTGYFALNLLGAGALGSAVCTDISPGMLAALEANAARLGHTVETVATQAEDLPFADESFDLVFGHAVLHHLPEPALALSEFRRVLRPGGTVVFAGEPSRTGDLIARIPKRAAIALSPAWRGLLRVAPATGHASDEGGEGQLEHVVDQHAFLPGDLRRWARDAGLSSVRVTGEELLANWFGWFNRTLEATAEPAQVPWLWRQYAYRGYLALQAVDRRLLEPTLPAPVFYNLMLAAEKPAD
jgi:ubiquinone/menaquinone biosynthesis C-methylase UbiE